MNGSSKTNKGKSQGSKQKEEVKSIIGRINSFLKSNFEYSMQSMPMYCNQVKDLFIELATMKGQSPHLAELFSKLANILQPFLKSFGDIPSMYTSINNSQEIEHLKRENSLLDYKIKKIKKKMINMHRECEEYRQTNSRITHFLYMLKKSNVDIDCLYNKFTSEESEKKKSQNMEERGSQPTIQKKIRKKKPNNEVESRKNLREQTILSEIQIP